MQTLHYMLLVLTAAIAGCGHPTPDGPVRLSDEEKDEIQQHLRTVHEHEAAK